MKTPEQKQFTLAELTHHLDVTIQGDSASVIQGVSTIQCAQPGHITFLMNPLYKKYLADTHATAVILTADDAKDCLVNAVVCKNPYFTYAKIATFFDDRPRPNAGIHPTAVIGEDCEIHPTASIGPHCVLSEHVKVGARVAIGAGCVIGESSIIGEDSLIQANVTLYHKITIGKRVIIASGTVIGSDGFGIAQHQGVWNKVPQLGRVMIEDDVEIGANCAIDRGAIEDTIIGKGSKLDNQIQIGHNVRIGQNTAIAGCVGIAGSATIGNNCMIGGSAGIGGHITITDNVVITGMTVVSKSIREPGVYSSGVGGLVTNAEWRKISARIHRLDHLALRVKSLEQVIKMLERDKQHE